jgi:hypothetical protein
MVVSDDDDCVCGGGRGVSRISNVDGHGIAGAGAGTPALRSSWMGGRRWLVDISVAEIPQPRITGQIRCKKQ